MRILILVLLLVGCAVESGGDCAINSDCEPGYLCGQDGRCVLPSEVRASLQPDAASSHSADTADASEQDATSDTGPVSCVPAEGIFVSSSAACLPAREVYTVKSITVVPGTVGVGKIAELANPVIRKGFEEGTSSLELWVDGTLNGLCEPALAWMSSAEDRAEDCTATYQETFPFRIPGPIGIGVVVVEDAEFSIETSKLTGLVAEEQLLGVIAPTLRSTADDLVAPDVDTDGDGSPDRLSVELIIGLSK